MTFWILRYFQGHWPVRTEGGGAVFSANSLDLLEIIQKLNCHSIPKNMNLTYKDPHYWEPTQTGYRARK